MKPIKLRIKGLNSFQEEQSIDFLKLTDSGLFGIFGPTGSGKSTILDGITIALYGSMARKSSNFINTNCDRLNVSFEFQISGSMKRIYLIDREFKRKKDGSINSGKCKLLDITNENNKEILADSVKSINKKVEEIIGLNIDDFTRTVVLPQGKFSDFLKLEGKDRREMLERLFNLEKYGDKLSEKLFSKIKTENTKRSVLEGQLKGYEDISFEKLEENEEILKNNMKEYTKLREELELIEKKDRENEELWNAQNELNKYAEKKKALDEKFISVENMKMKIRMGEASEKVIPYVDSYENTLNSYLENNLLLEELKQKIDSLTRDKEIIENKWIYIKNEKDEKLSELLINEQKIRDAIEDEKYLEVIRQKLDESTKKKENYKKKLSEDETILDNIQKNIQESIKCITNDEKTYEDLKIDEIFKEKVQDGLMLEESVAKLNDTLYQEEEKINKVNILINETIRDGKGLKESLKIIENSFKENKNKLEVILENCPGDQNELLQMQKFIGECSLKYETYSKLTVDIDKLMKDKNVFEKNIKENEEFLRIHEYELRTLKENLENAIRKSMVAELRKELKKGEHCPVCGSSNHNENNQIIFDEVKFDLGLIEENIKSKENRIKDINNAIIKDKTQLEVLVRNIKENREAINKLGDKFREISIETLEEKFEKLKIDIDTYNKNKEVLESKINKIAVEREKQDGEIKALRDVLRTYRNQLIGIEKDFVSIKNEKDIVQQKLNCLKTEICVGNFKDKNIEIRKIETERNNILDKVRMNRKFLGTLEEEKDNYIKDIKTLSEEIVKRETEINSYERIKMEKIESIKNKVGNIENLQDSLNVVGLQIKNIKDNYSNIEKEKKEIEDIFKKYSEKLISSKSKEKILRYKKENEKENMNSAMLREGFSSIDNVKNNIIKKDELLKLKEEVEIYRESMLDIQSSINNLKSKIGEKNITKNQYEEIKNLKISKKDELNIRNEFLIRLKDEIDRINIKLKEQKDLLKEKKLLEHRIALLKDLEKLFKGKRFVEFVALNQLKYISIEASRRLKEITLGTYGLEVDCNGKFVIRDYKNGGAMRDSSTLSGGETFLASLSLALALSAQIQLKGTAPLELFFLDEGFGTLDDNLLDTVMDSLERIYNDRLKVGIISHVESIKNRVPVKLIVSPAECGGGGSKVSMERN